MSDWAKISRERLESDQPGQPNSGPEYVSQIVSQSRYDLFVAVGKGGGFRPAVRVDNRPAIDPLTQRLANEQTSEDIQADQVVYTTTATAEALPPEARAVKVLAVAQDEVNQTDVRDRELALAILTATNAVLVDGGSLTARQQAMRDRAKAWVLHFAAVRIEARRAIADGDAPTLPAPPTEDLP